jgi:glycosyltransferase involved in cell wall biosynthesis
MFKDKTISLIIPCLDEEAGLRQILPEMPDFLDEVVVADNGSTDKTAEIARRSGALVVREEIGGYTEAVKRGIKEASGQILVFMDGDGTYDPADIKKLAECLAEGKSGFVNGSRFPLRNRLAMNTANRWGNFFLTWVFNLLADSRIKDSQTGMWVMTREFAASFDVVSTGFGLPQEMKMEAVYWDKKYFYETGINYRPRKGKTKLNIYKHGLSNLRQLFYKRKTLKNAKAA